MGEYLTTSSAELEVAEGVAKKEFPNSYSLEECATELKELAFKLLSGDISLLEDFPKLKSANLAKDFPSNDLEITNNLFSVLSTLLVSRFSTSADRGAVNTPYNLAYDMVATGLASKLHRQQYSGGISEAYHEIKEGALKSDQKSYIASLNWLDPCVGTGVFPIATLNLLKDLGVVKNIKQLQFTGYDIDPIAVEATRIRVACNLSNGLLHIYQSIYPSLEKKFIHANSLEVSGMQGSLLSGLSNGYDLIVGNPPYVRSSRLTPNTKSQLKSQYPSIYHGTADLYVYFIASAINSLNENGVVSFVSPAHFTKSNYGKTIRSYIDKNAELDVFIDFNELKVFEGISSHICVYILSNGPHHATYSYLYTRLPSGANYLSQAMDNMSLVPKDNINAGGWNMHPYDVSELLASIFNGGTPLKDYVGNIYSGIKTGSQSVYVIGAALAAELMADAKSKPFIKPYVAPRKISRWATSESAEYLIVIKKGETVAEDSLLMKYLLEHKEQLEKREDISNKNWYALRDCSYYDLFDKPKIIYPDISKINRFSIDYKGRFITDGAFLLPSSDLFLLGILNSSLAHFYFRLKLGGFGTAGNGGRIRFKKVYVENFPLPPMNSIDIKMKKKIEKLVAKHLDNFSAKEQAKLDELVYNVYNISTDIKELVEEKLTA